MTSRCWPDSKNGLAIYYTGGKTVEWTGSEGKIVILFDMPIRHPNGDAEYDAGYVSLEIKKLMGRRCKYTKLCRTDSHSSSPSSAFKWIL